MVVPSESAGESRVQPLHAGPGGTGLE